MAKMTPTHWLNVAIDNAGGTLAFSNAVKAPSTKAVQAWKLTQVPAAYCPDIEALTGVRCEKLRPDVNWAVLRKEVTA